VSDFSAKDSALGYLFQARYALWLILDGPEERETVLETLDDVVFETAGLASELLQTKHHSAPATLTNNSAELWKTLRIWSTHVRNGEISVPSTALCLVTTAVAPDGSIASMLPARRLQLSYDSLGTILVANQFRLTLQNDSRPRLPAID